MGDDHEGTLWRTQAAEPRCCASTPKPPASTLTAQQPLNNVVRTTLQALAAVLGGTQSLHTNGYDEALSLPTAEAATLALRTQQIIGYESGVAATADPLAGSYVVEALTDALEAKAWELIEQIDAMGGAVDAIEQGWMQGEIAEAAYQYQQRVESGEQVVVGVNRFAETDSAACRSSTRRRRSRASRPLRWRAFAPARQYRRRRGAGCATPRRAGHRECALCHARGAHMYGDGRRGVRRAARRVGRVSTRGKAVAGIEN